MIQFDKNKITNNRTPIINYNLTYDFYKDLGVQIRVGNIFKPLKKYIGSISFINEKELQYFIDSKQTINFID